jgi:alkyldihydroxyacetonephosphate synthase
MRFWGWGEDAHAGAPPEHGIAWLEEQLGGALGSPEPPVALEDVRLPPSALGDDAAAALTSAAGSAHAVRRDRAARVVHAAGKGYPDLVRLRAGRADPAPDAVVTPVGREQLAAVLGCCRERSIAVVPFGGGTSVVGGVEPLRGSCGAVIALDLGGLSRLLELDPRSGLARVEAGLRGPELEHLLRTRGHTLGHYPQSFEYATVGGWVATRSAGQASTGYGRIDELVRGVRLVAPAGELDLPALPASAAGPDLRELVVGSEGVLGVLSDVTLEVRRRPAAGRYEGWMLPSFAAGREAFRELAQDDAAPDVARLSDEHETTMSFALAGLPPAVRAALDRYLGWRGAARGAAVIAGWEGEPCDIRARHRRGAEVLRRHGGVALGRGPGQAWAKGRFHAPYLRDELLGRGVFVETLETATTWANLGHLYSAVGDALRRHVPFVACHISHVYVTGASLYFTFVARRDAGDPIGQWQRVKDEACAAIVGAGGTITHHHAVGRDHARFLPAETGDLGLEALRAVKAQLDPAGIMNPGKLLTGA